MSLPKAKRVDLGANVRGGPYDDMRKPKVCWHRTQGSSLAGARTAFAAYPPHIGYDPSTRELEQYIPLNLHSYAFFNSEADDEYIVQIEVVGFSEDSHNMPDWQVQNIVDDLVDPLEELIGVPPVVIWHGFHGAGEGIVLADPDSPIRISLEQLREFSGHLGHQHIPGDAHWDPGRFRIDEVLRRSQKPEEEPMSVVLVQGPQKPEVWRLVLTPKGIFKVWVSSIAERDLYIGAGAVVQKMSQEWIDGLWTYQQQDDALAIRSQLSAIVAKLDAGFGQLADDEVNIITAVRQLPTGGQVDIPAFVAALVPALSPALPRGITVEQLESTLVDTLNSVRLTAGD